MDEASSIFERYLNRSRVSSGEAFEAAQKDYREAASKREAEKFIPMAWRKLVDGNEDLLIELLAMEAEALGGYRPSESQVVAYLRSLSDQAGQQVIELKEQN